MSVINFDLEAKQRADSILSNVLCGNLSGRIMRQREIQACIGSDNLSTLVSNNLRMFITSRNLEGISGLDKVLYTIGKDGRSKLGCLVLKIQRICLKSRGSTFLDLRQDEFNGLITHFTETVDRAGGETDKLKDLPQLVLGILTDRDLKKFKETLPLLKKLIDADFLEIVNQIFTTRFGSLSGLGIPLTDLFEILTLNEIIADSPLFEILTKVDGGLDALGRLFLCNRSLIFTLRSKLESLAITIEGQEKIVEIFFGFSKCSIWNNPAILEVIMPLLEGLSVEWNSKGKSLWQDLLQQGSQQTIWQPIDYKKVLDKLIEVLINHPSLNMNPLLLLDPQHRMIGQFIQTIFENFDKKEFSKWITGLPLETKCLYVQFACCRGPLEIIICFINECRGLLNKEFGSNRNSLLHLAAKEGQVEITEFLIKQGISVDIKNACRKTPLHLACAAGQLKVVKALTSQGASIKEIDEDGNNPLQLAVNNDFRYVVDVLIKSPSGMDLDGKKNTLLHLYSAIGQLEIVKYLIDCNAPLDAKNKDGDTPLHLACRMGMRGIAELLIKEGAFIDDVNNNQETPLMRACQLNMRFFVEFLINNHADVNAVDKNGLTPLHLACRFGDAVLQSFLITNNANVKARDVLGLTLFEQLSFSCWLLADKFDNTLTKPIKDYQQRAMALKSNVNELWRRLTFGDQEGDIPLFYLDIEKERKTRDEVLIKLNELLESIERKSPLTGTPPAGKRGSSRK